MASPARRRRRLTERKHRHLAPPPQHRPSINTHATNPKYARAKRDGERRLRKGML